MMEHFEENKGEAFNLGLEEANISKKELAYLIKEQIPALEISESLDRTDPDQRNYIVSNKKILQAGFTAKRSLETGILEMIELVKKTENLL